MFNSYFSAIKGMHFSLGSFDLAIIYEEMPLDNSRYSILFLLRTRQHNKPSFLIAYKQRFVSF
jgi:hypothetical protein